MKRTNATTSQPHNCLHQIGGDCLNCWRHPRNEDLMKKFHGALEEVMKIA